MSDWISEVSSSDLFERICIDQMMRLRRERTMDGYDVGSFHQLGAWHVGHAPLLEDLIRDWVEGQERAYEPLKDIGHDRDNAASYHDPDRGRKCSVGGKSGRERIGVGGGRKNK